MDIPRFLPQAAATLFSALCLAYPSSAADWRGTESEKFQVPENWRVGGDSGDVFIPVAGDKNKTALYIQNGQNPALSYTAADGDTQFTEQLLVGQHKGSTGELDISGGSLAVNLTGRWTAIVGQTVEGVVKVSGGVLTLLAGTEAGAPDGLPKEWGLIIGNEPKGLGSVEVTGGEVQVGGGLWLGRSGGAGNLSIGGTGKVICDGPVLLAGGINTSVIELGKGSGILHATANGDLHFPLVDGSNSGFINFAKGSKGRISLHGKDKTYFDKLVTEGRIRIGGGPAKPEQFQFRQAGAQGDYSLAN